MMLEPSIDSLQKKIKSKYTLVALSARRARELKLGSETTLDTKPTSFQDVGVALEEIRDGKLHYIESDDIQSR
ncbi:DNA-directed RNA polymerase subunit omega [Thalassobacillus sp. CUG 92003]|uniref:DNA-directed RNA polymerase subunit omega n=1 Tax=Thalassobacillus sp. CUG 92003 TaxID=2736641 RepID=UPI0015E77E70|nr:DNA-directed RNA polymerase subunit omega [Thalassobacillus sp. CUG 92003]